MSSDYREYRLVLYVLTALSVLALVCHEGALLDFETMTFRLGTPTAEIRGVHNETQAGPIANATESLQGRPAPADDTAPIP